jgi:hypothetical protein
LRRSVDLHARLLVHVHHLRGPIAVVQLHALVRVALAAHTVVAPKKERKEKYEKWFNQYRSLCVLCTLYRAQILVKRWKMIDHG